MTEIVSAREAAAIMHMAVTEFENNIKAFGKWFPKPIGHIHCGDLWDADEIKEFKDLYDLWLEISTDFGKLYNFMTELKKLPSEMAQDRLNHWSQYVDTGSMAKSIIRDSRGQSEEVAENDDNSVDIEQLYKVFTHIIEYHHQIGVSFGLEQPRMIDLTFRDVSVTEEAYVNLMKFYNNQKRQ